MMHSTWMGRDGAPQGIGDIAQTPDSLLWIGTMKGLYSFDGLSFAPFEAAPGSPPLPTASIHFLKALRSGDLWVFNYHGPPFCIHQSHVSLYGQTDGPRIDVIGYPQEDSSGTLWAILNERQIARFGQDKIWHTIEDPGHAVEHITSFFVDSEDILWTVVNDRLYRRPAAGGSFQPLDTFVYGLSTIREDRTHNLWISSSGHGPSAAPAVNLQHLDHTGKALPAPWINGFVASILPGTDGSLWILKSDNSLTHLHDGETTAQPSYLPPDQITLRTGAANTGSNALMLAADGTLWTGGLGGLEHFAPAMLVPIEADAPSGAWDACVDAAGSVWISDPMGNLLRDQNGLLSKMPDLKDVTGIYCSVDGQFALTDSAGIAVWKNEAFSRLPLLPGIPGFQNHYIFTGLTQTRDKELFAAAGGGAIGHALWEYKQDHWTRILPQQRLPEVTAIISGRDGQLLLGFEDGTLAMLRKGALVGLPFTNGGIGKPLGFAQTNYGIFAFGAGGVALQQGLSFHTLTFQHPEHARSVTGLVQSKEGEIWLNSAVGIVRVAAPEIREGVNGSRHVIASTNLREGDFVGPSFPSLFSATADKDRSGRLWFSTLNGIVSVDPSRIKPSAPPKLTLRSIVGDNHALGEDRSLPPGVETLRIHYIGVEFKNPDQVTYRYRLVGSDKDWQEVGARTEAIYTHLRPGRYTFMVKAANAYGVWTEPVVSEPFTIRPRFYQTWWFAVLCVLALLLALWLVVQVRLSFLSADIRVRAEERAEERITIARDLHDTLLQGVQGLLMTFHTAAERVPNDHYSKEALDKALSTAERIILEGRDRVKGLRTLDLTDEELGPALESVADDLNTQKQVAFVLVHPEARQTLQSFAAAEIFLIAREAIVNAFRHADPTRVTVEFDYGKRNFTLTCSDNGRGFDPDHLSPTHLRDHWGLRGMSERAEKLGASFACRSAPGQGTQIKVILKASRAYN